MVNLAKSRLDEPAPAESYDNALRWIIPSRTDPHESYVVELNDAPGYDVCQCKWFVTTLGPLLKLGYTPERAVAENLVKLKKGERVEDALKCFHIRDANYRFGVAWKRFHCRRNRAEETELKKGTRHATTPHPAQTQDSPPENFLPPIRREDLRRYSEDLGPSPGL